MMISKTHVYIGYYGAWLNKFDKLYNIICEKINIII